MRVSDRTLLTISRWSAAAAIVLCLVAMLAYPGGTLLDPALSTYSLAQNFISDLGMTVTHGGHANRLGAMLFTLGFGALAVSLAAAATAYVRLLMQSARSRRIAVAAGIGGLLVACALAGTAVFSADRAMAAHMWLARIASGIAVLAAVLLAVASGRDDRMPTSVTVVWLVLAGAAAIWFSVGWWGPDPHTPGGLTFYATLQKVIGVTVVGGLWHQESHARRSLP